MTIARPTDDEKAALARTCPKCGARTGVWCWTKFRRARVALHGVRVKP